MSLNNFFVNLSTPLDVNLSTDEITMSKLRLRSLLVNLLLVNDDDGFDDYDDGKYSIFNISRLRRKMKISGKFWKLIFTYYRVLIAIVWLNFWKFVKKNEGFVSRKIHLNLKCLLKISLTWYFLHATRGRKISISIFKYFANSLKGGKLTDRLAMVFRNFFHLVCREILKILIFSR